MARKSKKASNALKHGAYSRKAMLPGEKLSDYKVLRAEHYEEWVPEGVTERGLVDDLVNARWSRKSNVIGDLNCKNGQQKFKWRTMPVGISRT